MTLVVSQSTISRERIRNLRILKDVLLFRKPSWEVNRIPKYAHCLFVQLLAIPVVQRSLCFKVVQRDKRREIKPDNTGPT